MAVKKVDLEEYAKIARKAAAESCVLLRNEKNALPFRQGDRVAVFGTNAHHYYKSGLGSGGLVNTRYVVSILDAMKEEPGITVDKELLQTYEAWIAEHPFDEGNGWGTVPWSQAEMPLTKELAAQAAERNDVAVVMIGRTAGEDQDNKAEEGSYYLTETEREMVRLVCEEFTRVVVILNTGNIIDMSWVKEYRPDAVLYVWQGGQEGGNGVMDVLSGKVSPCGKLTDTIAFDIESYPSGENFGNQKKNYYKEDIYVGYRYFETCGKEKVQYPFGYGLSYTNFESKAALVEVSEEEIAVEAAVTNTGECVGKEVVQIYVEAPQGALGKAKRVLAGYHKTRALKPGGTETFVVRCPKSYFASYDDTGVTGHKDCFVLEEGTYEVYAGADVRQAEKCGSFEQELSVLEQCSNACGPVEKMERCHVQEEEGHLVLTREELPAENPSGEAASDGKMVGEAETAENPSVAGTPVETAYTGNCGYVLQDVADGKISMDTFLAQLSEEELMCLARGEGMCSRKVTPGTAGAFGGLTESLQNYGIPAVCCADGPSGIRMDCGFQAFSLPNGTALGCTFNDNLVEQLFEKLGQEMRWYQIDTILGPGMNIHRHPLNGRNFEYISEDPVLTGKICTAQIKGLKRAGVEGTVKHFCANNQEHNRHEVESVVSKRALREIYLKGFELAIREGEAKSVMTTYGPLNGIWTAGNYDLCTRVLRDDWKFEGIVMTDWWAEANWAGEEPQKDNRAAVVAAQNDLYMCCSDTLAENEKDNLREEFERGRVKRSDLYRNAGNIMKFILQTPAFLEQEARKREAAPYEEEAVCCTVSQGQMKTYTFGAGEEELKITDCGEFFSDSEECCLDLTFAEEASYECLITISSELGELAQIPMSVYWDNFYQGTISFQGSNGKPVRKTQEIGHIFGANHYLKLICKGNRISVEEICIRKKEA